MTNLLLKYHLSNKINDHFLKKKQNYLLNFSEKFMRN